MVQFDEHKIPESSPQGRTEHLKLIHKEGQRTFEIGPRKEDRTFEVGSREEDHEERTEHLNLIHKERAKTSESGPR